MGARGGGQGPAGPVGGAPSDDDGSDSGSASNRWRRLYLGTQAVLSSGATLLAGANTLVGAIADKLNAVHLAIAGQTVGDILFADSTTTFARRAAVGVGQVFKSAGVGTAPAWGAIGGSTAATTMAKMFTLVAPAAAGVGVHAAIASDNAAPVTTGITSPAIPRAVQVVFAALWDGGDITIVGTDWADAALTEVIADNPGATVQGLKAFKTVTSINQQTVGAGGALTATVQTGLALGIAGSVADGPALAFMDVTTPELADIVSGAFTPTTPANGAHNYFVLANVAHTHSGTGLT